MITKIISGGQTGADRAALDFARKHKISYGGWLPKGRLTEAGPLDDSYCLQEMPTRSYAKRTERNVLEADGTLIVSHGKLRGGSLLTRRYAKRHKRNWLHLDLDSHPDLLEAADVVSRWISDHAIRTLNVAGAKGRAQIMIYTMG